MLFHSSVGFGFVTFQNEDVVDKVCEIHFHEINNKMVSDNRFAQISIVCTYLDLVFGEPAPIHYLPNPNGGTYNV